MCFADKFPVCFLLSVFPAFFFGMCSRFDLVSFRLSCDHGWIRSGSVNLRYNNRGFVFAAYDPTQTVLTFSPLTGGCSEGLDAFICFSNNNNTNCSTTILTTVAPSVDFLLFRLNAYPVSFMSLTLCLIAKL